MKQKQDIISLFHHIHHNENCHEVHHCGGKHVGINPLLTYKINHCKCNKHRINVKEAIGHNFKSEDILIVFNEKCKEGGWHIKSGRVKE